jgi:hypothetical protein
MNKLWLTTLIPIYITATVVLIYFGNVSYFNLPNGYIDTSIAQDIILIFAAIKGLLIGLKLVGCVALAMLILVIVYCCYRKNWFKMFTLYSIAILLLLGLFKCYDLGVYLAKTQTDYYVLSPDCPIVEEDKTYIFVGSDSNKDILISIDKNNKMENGFYFVDISGMNCKIAYRTIGKIIK